MPRDVVETEPAIDVEELDECAPEADLALAERLLAELLVRTWRQSRGKPIQNDITSASSTT